MSPYPQKEFLPCPLSPTILPLTMLLLAVLLFMLLPYLSHLLFPSSDLPKLTLLFFYLPLLVLTTPLSILIISLDLFLKQVPQCSIPPYFRPSFPNTISIPSPSLPPMVTPSSIPAPFSSSRLQPDFGPSPSRRSIKVPRVTLPGGRRAPRGRRRSRVTSTASCQTSPIPSYFWPDFQPSRVSSGGPSTDGALDLALMPRAYSQFPTNLPLDPLHFDFFTTLRIASPVVPFIVPLPLLRKASPLFTLFTFPKGRMPNLF